MAPMNERGTFDNYELFRWLQIVKQTIEENSPGSVTITASQVTSGVFDPARIPDLPFTRIQLTGRRLLGRTSDGLGDAEEIQVAGGLSLAGGILSMAGLPSGFVIGDLLYAQSPTQLARLADVAVGSYLRSGGVATAPLWSTLKLPNAVTAGAVVFATSANTYGEDPTNLFFDGLHLGIGTGAPGFQVDAQADAATINLTSLVGTNPVWVQGNNGSTSFLVGSEGSAGNELLGFSMPYATVVGNFGAYPLQLGTNDTVRVTIDSTGLVGIGTDTPTAYLHLKAGTTAANTAPLKFTSGSLLTTAEAGAMEFLTDAFYGTITTGAARKRFVLESLYASNNGLTMATARLLGRTTAGTGNAEELSVSSPLSLSVGALSITGAALTKTDDTNVTLSLGGSPTTALLAATSLTLGWTGTLSLTRGGLGFDASGIAKGGVFSGTGAGAAGIVTVGANGTVLTADSTVAGGVKWSAAGAGTVTGSGTAGTLPVWTSASALGDSVITQAGGIVTAAPNVALLNAANVFTVGVQTLNTATAQLGSWVFKVAGVSKVYVGLSGFPNSDASTDAQVFAESGGGIRLNVNGSVTTGVTIASTGAFTVDTAATAAALVNSTAANGGYLAIERSGVAKGYLGTSVTLSGNGTNNDLELYAANDLYLTSAAGAVKFYSNSILRWGINAAGDWTFGASSHIALSNGTPSATDDGGNTWTVATGGIDSAVVFSTIGGSAASVVTVTFGHTFNTAPACLAQARSGGTAIVSCTSTTTTATVTFQLPGSGGRSFSLVVVGF